MDLFKAIFADSDSSSDSEKEDDDKDEPMDAQTAKKGSEDFPWISSMLDVTNYGL